VKPDQPVPLAWSPDHAVLELMRARRDTGSRPGARTDGAKLGLSVEGGGMRGVVSGAMLVAIEDHGFADVFDAVYGGSSGSLNAAYFLTGNVWRWLSIYYEDLSTTRFLNIRAALLGLRPVLDIDWAFDTVVDGTKPLDYTAVLASATPLHVSITLVDEARVIAPDRFASAAELRSALRAGAWLPVATRGTAEFRGERALDGGALVSHPSRLALQDGATHVLSVSSRACRPVSPGLLQRYAAWRLDRMRPGLGRRFREADAEGQSDRLRLVEWRTQPASPAVLDLGPRPDAEISRHEIDPTRLVAAARDAYQTMSTALTGVRGGASLRLTTD